MRCPRSTPWLGRTRSPTGRLLPLLLVTFLLLNGSASLAQLVEIDDPNLPASPDGFNLTQDPATGLEWLDVTVSAGRTWDDIVGNDGSDELAPGGDFEGFRHATFLELTGWINGPQLDSLYVNFGFTSDFSSIGGYVPVRNFMSYVGCLANCNVYGYVSGAYALDEASPLVPRWAIANAFPYSAWSWGRLETYYSWVPTSRPENGSLTTYGHYLVREVPEPSGVVMLGAGLIGLLGLGRRRKGGHAAARGMA